MNNNSWVGSGVWKNWRIEGDKLISPTGQAYLPHEIEPNKYTQADLARALGVTRGAIQGRVTRGTLPPFDGDGYWKYETIQHLFG